MMCGLFLHSKVESNNISSTRMDIAVLNMCNSRNALIKLLRLDRNLETRLGLLIDDGDLNSQFRMK